MSTQHPDNANNPEWSINGIIEGDAEIIEAYKAFSYYNIEEVMWDAEGKDVDTHVIRKLLSNYPDFFSERTIGQDVFITYRIPNPNVEKTERKVLSETMESIAVSYDVAEKFYNRKVIPIFEVILPFTTSYEELIAILRYYEKVIVNRENIELFDGIKVKDIVGETYPKTIEIIPLVEDKESLLNIGKIVAGYWRYIKPSYLRIFIARSDPAMNYGMLSAVLLAKLALSELQRLSSEINLEIYPIIGVGSLPFRGNFNPYNIENTMDEYLGVKTFTIQSAFKYDYSREEVMEAINKIYSYKMRNAIELSHTEELVLKKIVELYSKRYQQEIEKLSLMINNVSNYVPKRRARKLHIGLFGYSRESGSVKLPRAIPFCGALYSVGLPPELLGLYELSKLNEAENDILESVYINFKRDLKSSAKFFNNESLELIKEAFNVERNTIEMIKEDINFVEKNIGIKLGGNNYNERKHAYLSTLFILALRENKVEEAKNYFLEMALIRKSIG